MPALTHPSQHTASQSRVNMEVAAIDREQSPREISQANVFDYVSLKAEDEAAFEQSLLRVHRKEAYLASRVRFTKGFYGIDRIATLEVNVEQCDVRSPSGNSLDIVVLKALGENLEAF